MHEWYLKIQWKSDEVIGEYRFSSHRLLEEEEEVIKEICKQEDLKPHCLRSDLQNWIDLAGKTSVLLAVNQVDAAIGLFQRDLDYVQGKVMAGARGSFHTNLKKMNMSKLFRSLVTTALSRWGEKRVYTLHLGRSFVAHD